MQNIADALCQRIAAKRSPIVVGLDPVYGRIPHCYTNRQGAKPPFELVADAIVGFNRDIIDAVWDIVPAVKPQLAFYEQYGSAGIRAFEQTIAYARSKDLIVVEDGKRNDIGNTAQAYAGGHLGAVEVMDGAMIPGFDVDFMTVSPFLGSESLKPFVNTCIEHSKGIFILVRTSNPGSGEVQEAVTAGGDTVSAAIAKLIADWAEEYRGEMGYSAIGAVVGATYPKEAEWLRGAMPRSIFLVPGYGAQGGSAADVLPCFKADGFGAIVNSSRNVLYAYEKSATAANCTREAYIESARAAAQKMREDIYSALAKGCARLSY